jgi:hypothetical protein
MLTAFARELRQDVPTTTGPRYNRGMSDPIRIISTFLLIVAAGYFVRATYRRRNN